MRTSPPKFQKAKLWRASNFWMGSKKKKGEEKNERV